MEKISWTAHVRSKCYRESRGEKYPQHNKRRQVKRIGHILRGNCLLKTLLKIEMTGRRGRRRKQLLKNLTKWKDTVNWEGKQAVENSLWKKVWTCR